MGKRKIDACVPRQNGILKAQSALDYLISYGSALLIIAAAIYIIASSGVLTPYLSGSSCTPAPGYICNAYAINSSGVLTVKLAQVTGVGLQIKGAACSTAVNSTNASMPRYGNIYVKNYAAYPASYPNNDLLNQMVIQSDSSNSIYVYCYGAGGHASSKPGNIFNGYLFINYTIAGLTASNIREVAEITTKYS
jgi:hypothetical protein